MTLDSFTYLFAILITSCLYYLLKTARLQNLFLLVMSFIFYFYLTGFWSIFLIFTIFITVLAIRLDKRISSLASIVLIVCQFLFAKKFVPDHAVMSSHEILFPLGISFFTFQAISLIIDYQKKPSKPKASEITLYLGYFPQLTAGPIEKGDELIPQFQTKRTFSPKVLEEGLVRIGIGFLKKFLIANAIAQIISQLKDSSSLEWQYLLLLPILCRYFIYSNFSAYTDIALGSSKLFNIKLAENFNKPLQSRNLTEFWQRWHMTLGRWVKSYIYFPLALNLMRRKWPVMLATFTSFVLIGLWHGLSLNFFIYGVFQAVIVILESRTPWLSFEAGQSFFKRFIVGSLYRYLVFMLPSVLFFFDLNNFPLLSSTKTPIDGQLLWSTIIMIFLWEVTPNVAKKWHFCALGQLDQLPILIRLIIYLIAFSTFILLGQHKMVGSFLYFYF